MNREELSKIKVGDTELPKEVIDLLMDLNGKSINGLKQELEKVKTEKEGLETQLTEANQKIESFKEIDVDKIKAQADEWKKKYETDTKALKDSLSQKDYDYKISELTNGLKFSSNGAKKSFINDLKEKGLKLENDTLLGFDDFVKSYQETDPSAFIKEAETTSEVFTSTGESHTATSSDEDAYIDHIMGLDNK
ncbi:MAG: phage scaffolding protein [Bacilli bacterium]|nr:phage scaffolding protein [Bacilli bacterium]